MSISEQKTPIGARAISMRLRSAIETGVFNDGDQLPTERELTEQYSAARSTIRNALDMLEDEGLLERKVGSGTFVTYSNEDADPIGDVVDQISPIQLIDARIGMERQMIRLAVIHARRKDVEILAEQLQRMQQASQDRDEFSKWDARFHIQIARCTGNPLMVHLYETINEVRSHRQWESMKNLILSPQQIKMYNEHHSEMLEGIRSRDTARAIDAVNAHMDLARSDLVGADDRL